MEQWKTVVIDDEVYDYEVSSEGKVRNVKTGRILKQGKNKGYYTVGLHKDGKQRSFLVHRLVATAFIPNPNNLPEVDHINRNRSDNRVENLRWVTPKQNIANRPATKVLCVETKRVFDSIEEAAQAFGINRCGINHCLAGRSKTAGGYHWQYVEEV